MDRTLWPATILLLVLFGIFEATGIDLWVQDHFYDFARHAWCVDDDAPLPRLFFYTGPKTAIWIFGILLLVFSFFPARLRERMPFRKVKRIDLWIVVATLALAPLLIATGKATTNVFTPHEIRRYDGFAPYVKVLESYPKDDHPKKRGRGFPAGHASGGFALLSLAGLAHTRQGRWAGILIGCTFGSAMGIYQMLKGAHYLSHTVVTALVCWIVFLILRKILLPSALTS